MQSSPPVRVAVVSLGCPKALVDTEKMLGLLAEAGCLVGAPDDQADVILINTCAFIAPAEAESLQAVRDAVARKAAGGARRVVVAGCLPQRRGEGLRKTVPGIDAIVGVFNRSDVVAAVTGADLPAARLDSPRAGCLDDRARLRLTPRHFAYLRLAEGCSQGCSYCTIPAIRGPLRSKTMDQVLQEAEELVADGTAELVLIAQDTTAYGRDLADGTDLAALLRRLDAVRGLRWIRLMYAHPASLSEATIAALAECPRVVKYLDLPLQHISDKVLHRMGRGYGRADVERLLDRLRQRVPGIALRTTFIVGFPGEGQADFDELAGFVRDRRFDAVGVFEYCPEDGTAAARLDGQVPEKVRRRRRDRLMQRQQQLAFAANAARIGAEIEVLTDGPDAAGRCTTRHPGQAPEVDGVCLLTRPVPPGEFLRGTVVGYDGYDLVVQPGDA